MRSLLSMIRCKGSSYRQWKTDPEADLDSTVKQKNKLNSLHSMLKTELKVKQLPSEQQSKGKFVIQG